MDLLFDDENTCQMAAKNKMSDIRKDKDCTFQPRAAEECLETLQYARCQQVLDEDGIQSCERVYRCDGEPEDGSDEDTGQ